MDTDTDTPNSKSVRASYAFKRLNEYVFWSAMGQKSKLKYSME
jgi:hypothetical protein